VNARDFARLCAGLAIASPAAGQGSAARPFRWAHVTYRTAVTAYLDAGRAEGLRGGDSSRVEIVRGDSTIALLRVAFLATHRAACDLAGVPTTLVVGDSVRFTPAAPPPAPDSAGLVLSVVGPAATGTPTPSKRSAGGGLRGRVGFYYLLVRPLDGGGAQVTQPSGDLRLSGNGLGGTGLGLAVDVRGRRSVQTRADGLGSDTRLLTRVYQAALAWQVPGSPLRFTAGRQYAPGIAPVGLVDGVAAQLDGSVWGGGVFAGSEPEPVNLWLSGETSQLGAYVRRHSRTGSVAHWGLSAGISGSYLRGGTNREFLYLQGEYATRRLSVFAAQEVDYYRAWRRVGGEPAISPTSTFATLQLRLTDAVALSAGIDSRRNVRLYRDVVNPETTFDDAFRRGGWAGLSARAGRFQAALDARHSGGGATGAAGSTTLSLGLDRLTHYGLSARSRSTRYTSATRSGWLQALTLGVEPGGLGSLQIGGGWRSERDSALARTSVTRWASVDGDLSLARSWLLILSASREQGGGTPYDLLYAGLSFRF
jgi:hypothetical protein